MDVNSLKARARKRLESVLPQLIELSHRLHEHPEIAMQEVQASTWLADTLENAGFQVTRGICNLPTAFKATIGNGPLHIAFCAEYDALPDIGHACGHNIIATTAVGAGIAAAEVCNELGLTITVMGTPGEEGAAGKIYLLEGGAFDGIHASMMIHPAPLDILEGCHIAAKIFDVHFYGKQSHASGFPGRGVNALDAMTIAQTAIGLLRQNMLSHDRVHGIITHGGDAPNVIPSHVSGCYIVRSATLEGLEKLYQKLVKCFEAGALATGAQLKIEQNGKSYAQVKHNKALLALFKKNAESLGRVFLDNVQGKVGKLDWKKRFYFYILRQVGLPADEVGNMLRNSFPSSTDMGNVSLAMPAIHPLMGIESMPAVNHEPAFAAACITPSADKTIFDGALAMAWTAIDVAADAELSKSFQAATKKKI